MNILLLGATGKLGQQLLTQSLNRGHIVTALVRTPAKVTLQHTNLTVVVGDVLDASVLSNVMRGKEAVVSSLGLGNSFTSNDFIASAVQVLLPVMEQHQVRRLLFVSAFGVGPSFTQANIFQRLFFRLLLKDMYADKAIGDGMIRKSNLDWTIFLPVKMSDGKATNKYIGTETVVMKGVPTISRADVASFILDSLDHASWNRMSPIVMKS